MPLEAAAAEWTSCEMDFVSASCLFQLSDGFRSIMATFNWCVFNPIGFLIRQTWFSAHFLQIKCWHPLPALWPGSCSFRSLLWRNIILLKLKTLRRLHFEHHVFSHHLAAVCAVGPTIRTDKRRACDWWEKWSPSTAEFEASQPTGDGVWRLSDGCLLHISSTGRATMIQSTTKNLLLFLYKKNKHFFVEILHF